MKFFPLVETADNSGLFVLTGAVFDASSASIALDKVAANATTGLRVAVSPYRAMGGIPAPITPSRAEEGASYELLVEQEDEPGIFASDGQYLTSQSSDAAPLALTLQLCYGRRIALMRHQPEDGSGATTSPEKTSSTNNASGSTGPSSVTSAGTSSNSGASANAGSAVNSGGSSATPAVKGA